MPLVNDADVQIHLPVDKLKVEDVPDDRARAYEDAERIIRGYLAGVWDDPSPMVGWTDPDSTPPEIRAIAGRFAAAKIYRVRYSENSLEDPGYAQTLYNEAMQMLQGIIDGDITVTDVTDPGLQFDSGWFEPNDDSVLAPIFTMGARF